MLNLIKATFLLIANYMGQYPFLIGYEGYLFVVDQAGKDMFALLKQQDTDIVFFQYGQ